MKNTKKWFAILLVFAMIFALTACNANKPNDEQKEDESQPVSDDREITVTDMSGDEVTIKGKVEKIINLWPAGTSSFFVMGAGDLISAVANNSPGAMNAWTEYFYPEAKNIHNMGGTAPAVEDVVSQSPDLVIIHPSTASSGIAQQIRDLGIPAINTNFSNYEEMIKSYTMLGEILGGDYQKKLNTWCTDVQEKLNAHRTLTADLAEEDKPVVYYIAGQSPDLLTTMAVGSIMQDWIESNGGIFASTLLTFDGSATKGSNVTAEEVFKINPDVIIVGGVNQHVLIKQLQETEGWKELNAVVNGRVYNNPYGCFNWDRFGLESLLQLDYALMCIQPELAEKEGITEETMVQKVIDFYSFYNGKTLTAEEAGNMLNGLLPDGTAEVN